MNENMLSVYFCKHGFLGLLKVFSLIAAVENLRKFSEKIWEILPSVGRLLYRSEKKPL